jgi:DNA primase
MQVEGDGMSQYNIPEETIREVLKHHDIVDVVGKFVHLTKKGKNYSGLCPFHSEKTPSFSVAPEKQIFHCFGCGKGGDSIKFMMEMDGLTFPEAVTMMAEEAGMPVTWSAQSPEDSERASVRNKLIEAHELAAKLYHHILLHTEQGSEAIAYLNKRGFHAKLIEQFQLGFAPNRRDTLTQFLQSRDYDAKLMDTGGLLRSGEHGFHDMFRDRVMFPICDTTGKVIAFGGRAIGDVQPKYLNTTETPLFNKSALLYNFHMAKQTIRQKRQVVLFEGYADVIKAWDAGVHNGVATMGTSLTEDHVRFLKKNVDEIVVCYDGDDAGQNAAFKSIALLEKMQVRCRVAVLPNRLDPDEYIEQNGALAFRNEAIDGAVSPLTYRLLYVRRNFKMEFQEGRLAYIKHAVRLIAESHSPTEREFHLKELAAEFQFSFDTLKQEMFEVLQELDKKKRIGDNYPTAWHNGGNETKTVAKKAELLPAYVNAEKHLLKLMIGSKEIADYVQHEIGDGFHEEVHAALAAHLYGYYADHESMDFTGFVRSLNSDLLENVLRTLALSLDAPGTQQEVEDYIYQIRVQRIEFEIERMQLLLKETQQMGDITQATQLAAEIIRLRNQVKAMKHNHY